MKTTKKRRVNYVNNAHFYEALVQFRKDCEEAEDSGDDLPPTPRYVGECLMQISQRLSYKPNFINYPFREEMVSDGLENAVMAIRNFNPDKTQNPFAYFTQVIYFAFIRRIHKEKRQLYIKHKVAQQTFIMEELTNKSEYSEHSGVAEVANEYMDDFVSKYEEKMGINQPSSKKKTKKGLEKFYEEKDDSSNN